MPPAIQAVLFAGKKDQENDSLLCLYKVGGRTLLERHIIQLSRLGVKRFTILLPSAEPGEHTAVQACLKGLTGHFEIIAPGTTEPEASPSPLLAQNQTSIYLNAHALIDQRVFKTLMETDEKQLFIYENTADTQGSKILAVKSALSHPLPTVLQDLLRASDGKMPGMNVALLPTYIANRRREIPILFTEIRDRKMLGNCTRQLISMGQKGTLDWPAKWVHPIFENTLVQGLVHTPVTPNMITVITGILGFWITYLFASGALVAATAGAMFVGILDGVDGKLARTKMLETPIGEAEHIVDKIVEYSWYLGLAWYFEATHGAAVWAIAFLIVGFAWAETVQGEFFRRLTTLQLDDTGTFDKRWRLISGRRNTFIWTFLPFAYFGMGYAGFWVLAGYSMLTFFVAQVRFIIRLREYGVKHSNQIASNITRTAYF